jgi:hypothetical protein
MSIFKNSDEMFFGHTEKSGQQNSYKCRTENGKGKLINFQNIFTKLLFFL